MNSPVYDPHMCEFVARMGRIQYPDSSRKKKEKIPVMFRIPDPPDPESIKVELEEESVHTDQDMGTAADSNPSLNDSQPDLPSTQSHQSYENYEKLTEEQQEFLKSQFDKMSAARQKYAREKDLEYIAQQLVNQTFLGKELSERKQVDKMLRHVQSRGEVPQPRDGRRVSIQVQKIQPEVSEELMGYIRKELERLVPIAKQERRDKQ